jgi:MurNAc alpha-1-phosphate uridylyltransferase
VAPFVYSGVQLITPRLYCDAPEGPFSNNLLWDRAEAAGRLYGLVHDGALFHVGTPTMLSEVNDMLSVPSRPWALP